MLKTVSPEADHYSKGCNAVFAKEQDILPDFGADERLIHAYARHGYELTVDIKTEHEMEKSFVLWTNWPVLSERW